VVDHFHVVKLMNERIDQLRRQLWHAEKDVNKRKVIKGTRWILLRNGTTCRFLVVSNQFPTFAM
ncbi:MAG: transposase, partial [Prevotella pectinovora]|uniref:transposase n=1 Tax=Prevotella pectinovora TaxID=1602169 RepID=UPI002E781782